MTLIKQTSPLFSINRLLQFITALVLFTYPFIIYFGLSRWGIQVIAPVLLGFFALRFLLARGKLRQLSWLAKLIALLGITLITASWLLKQTQWLLYYPFLVNLVLLLLFGHSLIKPPSLIERFARLTEPDLPESGVIYTRKVTQVWCLFFLINGSIALFTCLQADIAVWTLYNGAVSYLLMGLLMAIEWLIRIRVRQKS